MNQGRVTLSLTDGIDNIYFYVCAYSLHRSVSENERHSATSVAKKHLITSEIHYPVSGFVFCGPVPVSFQFSFGFRFSWVQLRELASTVTSR